MTVEVVVFAAVMVAVLFGMALGSGWATDRRGEWLRRLRDDLSDGALFLLAVVTLVWIALFLLVVVAAFHGALGMILPGQGERGGLGGLGTGALLVGLLGAPFLVWSTVIKQTTLNFQREGHITDRISKAVEQLGAEKTVKVPGDGAHGKPVERTVPNIEVRIGGILSLERIAQDSTRYDRGRDHVRCMEILCAYVRENAKLGTEEEAADDAEAALPRIDIQMVLDVIRRRSREQVRVEHSAKYRLDLRRSDLRNCDLSGGDYTGTLFSSSTLEGARLHKAVLRGTKFQGCMLSKADFFDANLEGVDMLHAKILKSQGFLTQNLNGVLIEGADVSGLRFPSRIAMECLGSPDTIVDRSYDAAKIEGINFGEDQRNARTHEELGELEARRAALGGLAKSFVHWGPYETSDAAFPIARKRFLDEKGLIGWPFEN